MANFTLLHGDVATEYDQSLDAFNAAVSGDVIRLDSDASYNDFVDVDGKDITFDLNGHTYDVIGNNPAVIVYNEGKLTVKDSSKTQAGKMTSQKQGINVGSDDSLGKNEVVWDSGTLETQEGSICVFGDGIATVNGGTVHSKDNAALMASGAAKYVDHFYTITVNDGNIIGDTESAGYANSGIYAPNNGIVNVNGGKVVGTAGAGIVVRAGKLNVTGGEIEGRGTTSGLRMGDANPTYCGGIEVCNAANYPGKMDIVSISGGEVKSANQAAVLVIGNPDETSNTANSRVVISGGSLDGKEAIAYVDKAGAEIEDVSSSNVRITGGSFNEIPDAFIDRSKLTETVDEEGNVQYTVLDNLQDVSRSLKDLVKMSKASDKKVSKLAEDVSLLLTTQQETQATVENVDKTLTNVDATTDKTYTEVETIKSTTADVLSELNELNSSMVQVLDKNQKILKEVAKLLGDDFTLNDATNKSTKQIYTEQIEYHINQAKANGQTSFRWNHSMDETIKSIFEEKGCKVSQPENLGGQYLIDITDVK